MMELPSSNCVLLYIDENENWGWGMFNVPGNMERESNSRCKSECDCIAQIKNEWYVRRGYQRGKCKIRKYEQMDRERYAWTRI